MRTLGFRQSTFLPALALAMLLAGCAASQLPGVGGSAASTSGQPASSDDSPTRPTAVHEALVTSTGVAGFFPFEGTTVRQTRADMQRDETTTRGTGTVSRFVVGTINHATITRVDRKLVWHLDPPKSTYTECPITGCPAPDRQPAAREERTPSAAKEPGCTMRIARNTFDVQATGLRQVVNGFSVEQFHAQWLLVLEDPGRRQSTSKLEIEFWTTAPSAQIREAQAVEASFARAAAKSAPATGLPPDLQRAMQQFLAQSLSPNERSALFNLGKEFEKIKGFPIKTTMRWGFTGNACGGSSTPADGATGGVMGALGALTGGAKKAAQDAPLFSITTEVKRYLVEPVRDAQFTVPAGFRRTN